MNKMALIIGLSLFTILPSKPCDLKDREGFLELTTIYGTTCIQEPVLIELIKSPAMERLKEIHQYGSTWYANTEFNYTRYRHSLGVMVILKMFNAPLEEQIDGLLHDVSHTVFSHVGDYVFKHRHQKTSYQDEIHEWFLDTIGVTAILQKHGFVNCCSHEAKKRHRCLEQDKPDLCADRIEYNLSGGLIDGLLTQEDVDQIIKSLHFENQRWFFDTIQAAQKFGNISLSLSENRFGSAWNAFADYCMCQMLLRALDLSMVDKQMIHFSYDDAVWNLLQSSNDAIIHSWINRVHNCRSHFAIGTDSDHDLHLKGSFLGTDPLIATENGLKRLSDLDANYAQRYARIKAAITAGHYVKFID